jgi:hypothetical protein
MSYMRQQVSARMMTRYQNNYHFGASDAGNLHDSRRRLVSGQPECHCRFHEYRYLVSIEKMCIAFSVLIVASSWVKKHNVMDLVGWVFALTLVSMLVVIRKPVQIIDYSNVSQVYQVDNVPMVWRFPHAHHASGMRWYRAMR